MPAKLEVIELEIPRLESLLEKIRAALGEEVARPFRQLLDSHVQLLQVIDNQEISLRRLKQLLFGAKTERTRDVFRTSDASSGDAPATARDGETAPGAAGSSVGRVESDGTFRGASGSSIGRFDRGTVRDGSGSSIGRIDADGTVRNRSGSGIGRIDPDGTCFRSPCQSSESRTLGPAPDFSDRAHTTRAAVRPQGTPSRSRGCR